MALGSLGGGGGGGLLAGTAHVDILPNLSSFGPRLKTELKGVLNSIGSFDTGALDKSFARLGANASVLGKTITKNISAPALGLSAVAFKMGADFDAVFAKMQGLAGVTADEIGGLKDQVLALATETGRGPTELADALYFIRSAGLSGQQALDALTVSAKASAAGLGDTATVADAVTSAVNAYAKSGLTAAQATDVMVAAVRDGKAEASDIAGVVGNLAPLASQLGVSFDQVGAALAALTKVGVDTDTAATNISAIFSGLLKTAPQSEKALEAVGLTSEGLRKDLAKPAGLLTVIKELDQAFHGDETAMAEVFPNIRALRGLMGLLAQNAGEVKQVFDDVANSSGSLDQAFDIVKKTDSFKLQQTLADAKRAAIDLGNTVAPIGSGILSFTSDALEGIERLPGPLRTAADGLVGIAVAAGPLIYLGGKIATGLGALSKTLDGLAASETSVGAASVGMVGAIGGIAAGALAGVAAGEALNKILAGDQQNVSDLSTSFENLAKTGDLGGTALTEVGANAEKLAGDIKTIQGNTLQKGFGLAPSAHRAVADIKTVNDALIELAKTKGPDVAAVAMGRLAQKLYASGATAEEVGKEFGPFFDVLNDLEKQAPKTAVGIDKIGAAADGATAKITPLEDRLKAAFAAQHSQATATDALDRVTQAEKDLADARADAAGTGPDAIRAAQAETDALRGLADATNSAADAQEKLRRARADLAEFDNATSTRIRDLERQQIEDRVVTTPEEARQKEIDLLKIDQDNADKRAQLQQNVVDAEKGVEDAADRVAQAQQKVADAAEARRQVQVDAAGKIAQAEHGVTDATLALVDALAQANANKEPLGPYLDALHLIDATLDPSSPLRKNLDSFLTQLNTASLPNFLQPNFVGPLTTGELKLSNAQHAGTLNTALLAQIAAGKGPISLTTLLEVLDGTFQGPLSEQELQALHSLGVPGFADGGEVPGPRGKPRLIVAHGGEKITEAGAPTGVAVHQENHFYGSDTPTIEELDVVNRKLGMRLAAAGVRG